MIVVLLLREVLFGGHMRLKETVDIDVLKKFGFQLVEQSETGFKRYNKHYGILLVTVCNNRLHKAIHITMQANPQEMLGNQRIVASIHQMNKDLCTMSEQNLLELQDEVITEASEVVSGIQENDWESQIRSSNPFGFMMGN